MIFLAVLTFLLVRGNVASTDDDPVTSAISKLRSILKDAPADIPFAFPKTKYRLALLLESRLANPGETADWSTAAQEISFLFEASALNETHSFPPSGRVSVLVKAASLVLDVASVSTDIDKVFDARASAEGMLRGAIDIRDPDGLEEAEPMALQYAHASAFEMLAKILLGKASDSSSKDAGDNERHRYLEEALELCNVCHELSPKEPVVDEFRGAILRQLYGKRSKSGYTFVKSAISIENANLGVQEIQSRLSYLTASLDVHKAYDAAAKKSHEAAIVATLTPEALGMSRYPCGTLRFKYGKQLPPTSQLTSLDANLDMDFVSQLWTRLVRHIVLAAAAAREAGLREEEDNHISYGVAIISHLVISEFVSSEQHGEMLISAGIRHKVRGEGKEASRFFKGALDIEPEDGHAIVQLASLGDKDAASVSTLSESYVAGLFDGYSGHFENVMIKDLSYRGHAIVAEAISRQLNVSGVTDMGNAYVLDIGCGTGLLGTLLRELLETHAQENDSTCKSGEAASFGVLMHGVDLSHRMVDASKRRKLKGSHYQSDKYVYNTVKVMEGTQFLKSVDSGVANIIVASDVLIYMGALEEFFQECFRVLKLGGIVSFTVEAPKVSKTRGGNGDRGILLNKNGRFSHSRYYLEDAAEKVGLEFLEWKPEFLRKQGSEDVEGAVVTLQRLR